MAEFLVEVYLSRASAASQLPLAAGARRPVPASGSRTPAPAVREQKGAHLLGSIFVPEDETCFYLFEAESAETLRQETARLGLQYERVVEVVAGCAQASAPAPPPSPIEPGPPPSTRPPTTPPARLDVTVFDNHVHVVEGLDDRSEPL